VTDVVTLKLGGQAGAHAAGVEVVASCAVPGWVVVHGGGGEVAAWSRRLGLEPSSIEGLRVTDDDTLEVAVAILRGLVNARLVAALAATGLAAIGLAGVDADLLRGERFDERLGAVGRVTSVNVELLDRLATDGLVPVVAPIARGAGAELLNVNADEVAAAVAAARGGRLVLLTDVPGVRDGAGVVERLTTDEATALLADGTAAGGMVPKLRAAVAAAGAGCEVTIADGTDASAVRAAFEGRPTGTVIVGARTAGAR
jgi:acetylglutamate kinase